MPVNPQFLIKQGDTRPKLIATLSAGAADVFQSAVFVMQNKLGVTITDAAASFDAPDGNQPSATSGGKIWYQWDPTDTLSAGRFRAELVVTFIDGRVERYPNDGYLLIIIEPNLGDS